MAVGEEHGTADVLDVAVVGGGIAGLAAAKELLEAGLTVAVFEESAVFGGKAANRTEWVQTPEGPDRWWRWVSRLEQGVRSAGGRLYADTPVLGLEEGPEGWRLAVLVGGDVEEVSAQSVIVAAGARGQGLLFPGWAKPGVITADAARRMIFRDRVLPGRQAVVVGAVDEALWTARELKLAGATEVTVVRADHPVEEIEGVAGLLKGYAEKWPEGTRDALSERSLSEIPGDIHVEIDWVMGAATGTSGVETVTLVNQATGEVRTLQADLVVLAHGRIPAVELVQLAGVRFGYAEALGGWVPICGPDMQTTQPGLYVAGGTAGADTMTAEWLSGRLAGTAVARRLRPEKGVDDDSVEQLIAAWSRASGPVRAGARLRLATASECPDSAPLSNVWSEEGLSANGRAGVYSFGKRSVEPWTVVCRCEDVTVGDVVTAVEQGARSPDDVKRLTRCGMGLCQARECRSLVAEVMSQVLGKPVDEIPLPNVRFPVRPVLLEFLAGADAGDGTVRSVLSEVKEDD
ncbi:NAD(P)/FAD-dependent oxidoreductase [Kyrpidia spormannii]|uniref:Thioredoxin reductase n=1 Tax=Kyrpidia spormannii TaxID=2055160 RepID=A0ACA8Z7C3_9BACL|nr:NAD(P)/FAD-dependent oxidoreductase [Kyrpidia spormannii]CAB3390721.1 Thioredoxin reductase [Kyrpidia spormannii]